VHIAAVKSSPPTKHPAFTGRMLFLSPKQHCQSTEGKDFRDNDDKNIKLEELADPGQSRWAHLRYNSAMPISWSGKIL